MDSNTTVLYNSNRGRGDKSGYNLEGFPIKEPESQMHTAMIIVGVLALAGIVGNSLVLYVFSGQRQKPTATVFILTLAFTDFITSTVTMPFTIVIEMLHFKVEFDIVCKLYQFLITSTIPFSAFVMVAIAVDRYLCIVHPFKHTMTMDRAKSCVVLLAILATVLGVLCCLMFGVYKVTQSTVYSNCTLPNETYTFLHLMNVTADNTGNCSNGLAKPIEVTEIINTGYCHKDQIIFGPSFFNIFQKLYSACFGVCAVVVIVLYAIIYHSVLTRRRKRLHASNKWCCLWNQSSPCGKQHEHTEFIVLNTECYDRDTVSYSNGNGPTYKDQSIQTDKTVIGNTTSAIATTTTATDDRPNIQNTALLRPRTKPKPERLRMANIKTALMLSVVALTYIIAFLPAWLMALRVIPMNVIVFYLYFTYNVANPVIYAFLNQSFRHHLKALIHTRKQACVNEVSRVTWESALQSSFKS